MKNLLLKSVGSSLARIRRRAELERLKSIAMDNLRAIEAVKGKTSPKLIKKSREYAGDILGWQGYAPWLYVYSAISGEFKEGWMPSTYYNNVVVPVVQGNHGKLSQIKTVTTRLLNSDIIPDVGYCVNGLFLNTEFEPIDTSRFKELIFGSADRVVFKSDNSNKGVGVLVLTPESFEQHDPQALGDGTYQAFVSQHNLFSSIASRAVGTLRLTTVREDDNSISVRAAYLRIGRERDDIVKSASQIRVPIDRENGGFHELGYMPNWVETRTHPDSGFIFSGNQIPSYDVCRRTVTELHEGMPQVGCIGWDVCVDCNNDVKVLEWNGFLNDIKFSEATTGPCFLGLGWERLWQQ